MPHPFRFINSDKQGRPSLENENTPRNAAGRNESSYCNNAVYGKRVRSSVDIAGKKTADVVSSIRAYPLRGTQGSYPS